MSNEGFGYDSAKVRELADRARNNVQSFKNDVASMYDEIESMGASGNWVGPVYNDFKSCCESYKNTAISELDDALERWISSLNNAAELLDANTAKNRSIING
jgi:hypothetical protein